MPTHPGPHAHGWRVFQPQSGGIVKRGLAMAFYGCAVIIAKACGLENATRRILREFITAVQK